MRTRGLSATLVLLSAGVGAAELTAVVARVAKLAAAAVAFGLLCELEAELGVGHLEMLHISRDLSGQ
jgi:hypothetical protein